MRPFGMNPQMLKPRWTVLIVASVVVAVFAVAVNTGLVPGILSASAPSPVEKSRKTRSAAMPVRTAVADRRDVPIYLDGLGTVQAYHTVTVRSRVDGVLDKVLFKEGENVRAGDVLATLDHRLYQAQLEQAEAVQAKNEALLANAKLDLTRYTTLGDWVQRQLADTTRATVKQLEATVRGDKAAVENARVILSYATITAPIDGRTGLRLVDAGNVVHASDVGGLVVVAKLSPITILFSLPQKDLPAINEQLRRGEHLAVLAMSADGKTVVDRGTLELVDNRIDGATGTVRLKAVVPNTEMALWPGGFVNVKLLLTTRMRAVVVPSTAVQHGPEGSYVFVVGADAKVTLQPVVVARIADELAMVDSGLNGGETVVVEGMARLKEGTLVVVGKQHDQRRQSGTGSPP